ncbi:MAG: DUF3224 domain-containing protein [Candidatus Dormibacteraceae bacterium]
MTRQAARPATGTFEVEAWDAQTYDEQEGTGLARATLTKHYHGDLTGSGTTVLLTVQSPAGPAAYVGIERFTGTLRGRQGSVVLRHSVAEPPATAVLVPATGTGAFEGLTGVLTIEIDEQGGHHYTFDLT